MSPSRYSRWIITFVVALFVATTAVPCGAAQLKLPKKAPSKVEKKSRRGKVESGQLAPHLACSICFERNRTAKFDPDSDNGLQNAHCLVCRKVTLHRQIRAGKGGKQGELNLPRPSIPELKTKEQDAAGATLHAQGFTRAVATVFADVSRVRSASDSLCLDAVDTLSLLGEEGREASRRALASDHAPTVLVGARVLWRHGATPDLELLANRLARRLPGRAAALLLDDFVAHDPIRSTPSFLAGLLDHPQSSMRLAVFRMLDSSINPDNLDALRPLLESKRSETRLRVVSLLRHMGDTTDEMPGSEDSGQGAHLAMVQLLELLSDPTARVAAAAAEALSEWPHVEVEFELLAHAISERWILRPNAYALLALVKREDRLLEPFLDLRHVEALLAGLRSSSPFVSGTCAAALAGIGFRSSQVQSPWLELEVVDRLVFALSAQEFHNDYSSLLSSAARRLERVTGERMGTDGPRWVEWWIAQRDEFTAQRATVMIGDLDTGRLALVVRPGGQETPFCLIGPSVSVEDELQFGRRGELFYLTESECIDLVEVARREQLLEATHLPGLRGSLRAGVKQLDISFGEQRKSFKFGIDAAPDNRAWFDRAVAAAVALRDRNLWQRYQSSAFNSRREFWVADAGWWEAEESTERRAVKLKAVVLEHLTSLPLYERKAALRELERILQHEESRRLEDFAPLVAMLREESVFGERSRILLTLALDAACSEGRLELELAEELWDLCATKFRLNTPEAVRQILAAGDPGLLEYALVDRRSSVRAVAVGELTQRTLHGRMELDVAQVRLLSLAQDKAPGVRAATYLALGRLGVEDAREELLIQARTARSPLREAALRGLGMLGGEYVFNVLLQGLTEPNAEIKLAAIEGLAELADPSSAQILMTYLGRESAPELSSAAERGLARLGAAAGTELLRAARTKGSRAQVPATFLLSRMGAPRAAPILMQMLSISEDDNKAMFELAVLTGIDFSREASPTDAWWDWWDSVVHDDTVAWFRAALELRGITAPESAAFGKDGPPETALFLRGVIETWLTDESNEHLLERARRELEALTGRELDPLPITTRARRDWLEDLTEWLAE